MPLRCRHASADANHHAARYCRAATTVAAPPHRRRRRRRRRRRAAAAIAVLPVSCRCHRCHRHYPVPLMTPRCRRAATKMPSWLAAAAHCFYGQDG